MQRASSDLKLNPHLHVVFLDGVYTSPANGGLVFRALPHLSTTDVADALQIAFEGRPGVCCIEKSVTPRPTAPRMRGIFSSLLRGG